MGQTNTYSLKFTCTCPHTLTVMGLLCPPKQLYQTTPQMDFLYSVQQNSLSVSLKAKSRMNQQAVCFRWAQYLDGMSNLKVMLIASLNPFQHDKVIITILQPADSGNSQMQKVTLANITVTKPRKKNCFDGKRLICPQLDTCGVSLKKQAKPKLNHRLNSRSLSERPRCSVFALFCNSLMSCQISTAAGFHFISQLLYSPTLSVRRH